ncbi:MAG TPA: leucyl aminopeptidase family protein [Bacteroidia bacterium]|nr:leucyl aminopeptidase family protein [Bacteroidia bacterium]HRS59325.1 leucyl aminopeptidase family protein [Bacteroidia bacterium]HRU69151.1 leucyl aminopeptidase family protein [Bacteroidia bacterium]
MLPKLSINKILKPDIPTLAVIKKEEAESFILANKAGLSAEELNQVKWHAEKDIDLFRIFRHGADIFIHLIKDKPSQGTNFSEVFRTQGALMYRSLGKYKYESLQIYVEAEEDLKSAYLEGFLLNSYQFSKFKTDPQSHQYQAIQIIADKSFEKVIEKQKIIIESIFMVRDWINEPGSELTAVELGKRIEELGKKSGFTAEVWQNSKIKSLKMNGLLGVNRGSKNPPTFSVLEWKPENAVNKKPLILVGKGVVFDTGGLSLKPTPNSMDYMKSDMSGAAIVAGVFQAVSQLKIPVHLIGLIPATDNRPGEDAILPGDIIKMYDGTTVEVLNTDAEGRLILADALAYAKNYQPDLVIDLATLTGAASVAIGKYGMVAFFKTGEEIKQSFIRASDETSERFVEFPLWDDYAELIKSDIAEIKNTGGRDAGAITAAKFLEKFTDYPWIHFDIAGVSFAHQEYKYYPKGGTAIGLRLIINYLIQNYSTK